MPSVTSSAGTGGSTTVARFLALVALLTVLPLAACADDEPPDRPDPEPVSPATQPDGTSYTSEVTVTGDSVRIDWTLANDGTEALLVAGDPDAAYVVPRGDGVEIAQRVFDWPDTDKTWEVAPRVEVTTVEAGESLNRTVVVPLPLAVRHPFGPDLGDGPLTLPGPPTTVTFCLGVIAPPYPPALSLRREAGLETVNHGNVSWDSQYVFCSEPAELPES